LKLPSIRTIVLLILAMALGYASWVLPPILIPGTTPVKMPPLISVATDVERSRNYSTLCLAISGLLLGLLDPRRGPHWGTATMLPVFGLATLEGLLNLAPHNLYGIEVIIYAVFTLPAVIGGYFGRFLRRLISRARGPTSREPGPQL
jgi:hypothetical protein